MQFYRVDTDYFVPENVDYWSSVYPNEAEIFNADANAKMITQTSEQITDRIVRFSFYFNTEEEWTSYEAYRPTIPEYQDRCAYEQTHGITRTVVFQGYVDL